MALERSQIKIFWFLKFSHMLELQISGQREDQVVNDMEHICIYTPLKDNLLFHLMSFFVLIFIFALKFDHSIDQF